MNPFPDIKPIHRLVLPFLVGTLAYLAILLAFDTVERMLEDFFTRELFFCVVVSVFLLEANRGLLLAFKKKLVYQQYVHFVVLLKWWSRYICRKSRTKVFWLQSYVRRFRNTSLRLPSIPV